MKKIFTIQQGQAMLITLLILSASFLVAMALGGLVLYELRSVIFTGESVKALYAAESGLEWKLYEITKESIDRPFMTNNTSFDAQQLLTGEIRSIGQSGETYRALEVTF